MNLIFIVSKIQEHSNGHWVNISALSALVLAGWGLRKMWKKGLFSIGSKNRSKNLKPAKEILESIAIDLVYILLIALLLAIPASVYFGFLWLTGSVLASMLLTGGIFLGGIIWFCYLLSKSSC